MLAVKQKAHFPVYHHSVLEMCLLLAHLFLKCSAHTLRANLLSNLLFDLIKCNEFSCLSLARNSVVSKSLFIKHNNLNRNFPCPCSSF